MLSWIFLFFAGAFEVGWAVGLEHTKGFTRLWPSILTVGAMVLSMWLLALAVREIPVSTAYPIWVGVGVVGTVTVGWLTGEHLSIQRGVLTLLLIGSIVGLKLTAP